MYGFIPNSSCVSTLILITKKNKLTTLSDTNNYCAIALSRLFGTIMDARIINNKQ